MKHKIRVLIDLDRLKDRHNGLGQVAENLGNQLSQIENPALEFTFLVPKNMLGFFGDKVKYEIASFKRRWFPSLCKAYDIWYTIHQDSWFFPSTRKTPYLLTINDLNFLGEKSPKKAQKRLARLQKKVNQASRIITISQYTADEVTKHLQLNNIPIQVVYCGVKVNTFSDVSRPIFAPSGRLLFSVGVVQKKKNYEVLLPFMQLLPKEFKLIIAGNKTDAHASYLEDQIQKMGLSDRILLPGLISDQDKYWMYEHCEAVLFPSKFEGMGFPPVEAMRSGKPVFASTYSSIPEVSGDKAYYWENFEPQYMLGIFVQKLAEFQANKELPAILYQHSLKYTWEENANELIHIFKNTISK